MNIKRSKKSMNFMPYVLFLVVILATYLFLNTMSTNVHELNYTELTNKINVLVIVKNLINLQ